MDVLGILGNVSVVALLGALIWLIRLEGVVKANSKEIKRLGNIEGQTQEQEVRISQRDEEMRAIKFSLDELKTRVTKVENSQVSTEKMLTRIETKLDMMLKKQGMD